ncbi:hypothetical protein [Cerasicoccus fimbriatus]|uniref:hypothetical protein n=1 Tax=Cerasicoccus fimbriatus TaxID=3014554 RepID=UPI0022B2BC0A|nr:hypothetical protein [Cerasicoccus sp. TK19100]
MMNFKTRILLFLGACLASISLFAQDRMVNIYLEPDINGTIYFQESMDELNDLEPRPLLDGGGAGQGWMFVQYPGKYVGYVPDSEILANDTVRNGSKAFLRPDLASPVLAVIIDGDEAEVARIENGWATIYFEGEAPAYFRLDDSAASSAPALAPAATIGKAPQSASANSAPANSSNAGNAPVLQEVTMQDTAINTPVTAGIRPMSQSVSRYIQGKFERITAWDRLFGSDYDYRLLDANDDTVAYVKVNDTIIFGTIESYFGQRVEIQGVMKRIKGSVPLEVTADNIRVLR